MTDFITFLNSWLVGSRRKLMQWEARSTIKNRARKRERKGNTWSFTDSLDGKNRHSTQEKVFFWLFCLVSKRTWRSCACMLMSKHDTLKFCCNRCRMFICSMTTSARKCPTTEYSVIPCMFSLPPDFSSLFSPTHQKKNRTFSSDSSITLVSASFLISHWHEHWRKLFLKTMTKEHEPTHRLGRRWERETCKSRQKQPNQRDTMRNSAPFFPVCLSFSITDFPPASGVVLVFFTRFTQGSLSNFFGVSPTLLFAPFTHLVGIRTHDLSLSLESWFNSAKNQNHNLNAQCLLFFNGV